MEQRFLLDDLKKRLDEISEREEVIIQHPRQGKSYSALVRFIEQIREVEKIDRKQLVVVMSSNISNDIKILEAAIKSFPNIEIVCYNNAIGTMGTVIIPKDRNCFDKIVEYGMDFGCELDRSSLVRLFPNQEGYRAELVKDVSIMKLKDYPIIQPLVEKHFDYKSGKRKGKYSKYHNKHFHNNKHYNNKPKY